MPPLVDGSQHEESSGSSQESDFVDFPECDERADSSQIPQFKEAKPFKDRGSVNLPPADRQRLIEEIRKMRPGSIFEYKSSLNRDKAGK